MSSADDESPHPMGKMRTIREEYWDDFDRPHAERKLAHQKRIKYAFSRPTLHASSGFLSLDAMLEAEREHEAKSRAQEAWSRLRLSLRTLARRPGTNVVLHVYNVSQTAVVRRINHFFRVLGTGAYHAAVEVYGKEWSYGCTAEDTTGVFWCDPGECEAHTYREPVEMGRTDMSQEEVQELLEDLSDEWRGPEYDLLRKNCCNFSNEMCEKLGVGPIPHWVLNLASAGAKLEDNLAPAVERFQEAVDRGKEARGAWAAGSTHIGDFTRGLVVAGQEARAGSVQVKLRKRDRFCCACDCLRGFSKMLLGS